MSGPEEPRRPEEPRSGLARRLRVPDPLAAKRSMASAYQGAIEAVVAMVVCALAGWWIDGRLGSEPFGLFAGMGIGFAAFLVRLLRIKAPNLGRAQLPSDGSDGSDEPDEPDAERADWTQALTPDRDTDDDEGSRPK